MGPALWQALQGMTGQFTSLCNQNMSHHIRPEKPLPHRSLEEALADARVPMANVLRSESWQHRLPRNLLRDTLYTSKVCQEN
mmetsp:Transcript_59461/g.130534  ORF Transcript_59461/g.130534 Transcript_59461/m.130534 type:complete len:82 (-) Transcript_59461:371-616(-)